MAIFQSAFPATRGGSSASIPASFWDGSNAGTGKLVGVKGLLSSARSFDIRDVEMSPSELGHSGAGSDPVVIVVEAVTRGRLGSEDDTFSLPGVWHFSTFSAASHFELLGLSPGC